MGFSSYYKVDPLLLWYINNIWCQRWLSLLYFKCGTFFKMDHDNNLLCYNNYLYKCGDSNNNIVYVNIYGITKKLLMNYLILFKYQILLIDQVIGDKIEKKKARAIFFPNQA